MFLHLCILTEEIKENLIINYKILFASLFDIITKPPSLSILFFHPTLTPLLPHSPSQHSCHFIFLSHHSFHPILPQPLFSPHSPSHYSFHSILPPTFLLTQFPLTPLFSPHYLSHHSFHAILPHSFHPILPHTILFTSFSLTPLFSLHSSSHHSFHTILSNTTLFTPLSHFILLFL